MSILKTDFEFVVLAILLLLQEKCFYLIPWNVFYSINSNQQQILMVIVTIISFVIICASHQHLYFFNDRFVCLFLSFFLCWYIISFVHSAKINNQSLLNVFISSNYLLIVLIVPICFDVILSKGLCAFLKVIIFVAAINIVVCWVQFFSAGFGFVFTHIKLDGSRFGSIRIWDMSETLTCLGILASLVFFLFSSDSFKKKRIYLFVYALGFLGNIFVAKGRVALIGLIVCSLLIILCRYGKSPISLFFCVCVCIFLVWSAFTSDIGQQYLGSFNQTDTDTASVRIREYNYYWQQIIKDPFWGTGYIRDNGDAASVILRGPTGKYSRTDVGIIGVWDAIGLPGLFCFLLLNCRCILIFFKKWISLSGFERSVLLSFFIFSLILMPTMAFFAPFSITSFMIIWTIFEILNYKYTNYQARDCRR